MFAAIGLLCRGTDSPTESMESVHSRVLGKRSSYLVPTLVLPTGASRL